MRKEDRLRCLKEKECVYSCKSEEKRRRSEECNRKNAKGCERDRQTDGKRNETFSVRDTHTRTDREGGQGRENKLIQ